MTPTDLVVREARLALEAHGAGNKVRYDLHRTNARRLADRLNLQVRRLDPPTRRPLRPVPTDYGIEGPGAQVGCAQRVSRAISIITALAFALGFAGRRLGWF